MNNLSKKLSVPALFACLLGSSALAGCDQFLADGGEGSVEITTDTTGMVAAGGVIELHADLWVDESEADWTISFSVDGGTPSSPSFGRNADGSDYVIMQVDTMGLANGVHEVELLLWVDGDEYRDVTSVEVVDGVVLQRIQASNVGWDGDYGGAPDPQLQLFDASDNRWLGCARLYDGVAFRQGGIPVLRSALEGRSVYLVLSENDDDSGCDEPSLWADDLLGNADDFVGQSEPFTLQDGVVVSFDTTTAAISFGRGL
jgi:hypothetical protein